MTESEIDHYEFGLRLTQAIRLFRPSQRSVMGSEEACEWSLIRLRDLPQMPGVEIQPAVSRCLRRWEGRFVAGQGVLTEAGRCEYPTEDGSSIPAIARELAELRRRVANLGSDRELSRGAWLTLGLEIADGVDAVYAESEFNLQESLEPPQRQPFNRWGLKEIFGTHDARPAEIEEAPSQKVWRCRNEAVVDGLLKTVNISRQDLFPQDPITESTELLPSISMAGLWGWQVLEEGLRRLRGEQTPENFPADDQLVTLKDIARLVKRSAKTLSNRYRSEWPEPVQPHQGRRGAKWNYVDVLPVLRKQFAGQQLPDTFPR